jgi:hypothetical protein
VGEVVGEVEVEDVVGGVEEIVDDIVVVDSSSQPNTANCMEPTEHPLTTMLKLSTSTYCFTS